MIKINMLLSTCRLHRYLFLHRLFQHTNALVSIFDGNKHIIK